MRIIKRDIAGAFIFSKDNKLLLGKSIKGGVYPDEWIVPGGGVEKNETKLEAMKREIKEEVGINLDDAEIEFIEEPAYGESEKTLRDSDEKVLVKMTFWDFLVRIPKDAKDINISLDDDLNEAEFFPIEVVKDLNLGTGTRDCLKKWGYI